MANWHFIAATPDYFATVANPSPLQHTWTLAIEEQFYLIWPLILLGPGGRVPAAPAPIGRADGIDSTLVAGVALAGAVASALAMACPHPGRGHLGQPGRTTGVTPGPRAC